MTTTRQRYITRSALGYLVLAGLWILVSDRLFAGLADVSAITWFSTLKGLLFVLVTGALLYYGMHAVPDSGDIGAPPGIVETALSLPSAASRLARWPVYALAVALTLGMLVLRDRLGVAFGERPLLILFVFPIILSALFGGLGPGLAATALASVGALYFIPPVGRFRIEHGHDLFQWLILVANGVVASVLGEGLLRSLRGARSSRELLRAVTAGTPDAVFVKDREGRYLLINEGGARFLGGTINDIIGHDDTAFFASGASARLMALDRAIMDAGQVRSHEEDLELQDGRRLTFLVTKGPVFDSRGRVAGLFGISRDITERKQASEALAASEARYRQLFDANPHPMWVYDRETLSILAVNDAAVARYGYGREEFLSMTIRDLRPAGDVPELVRTVKEVTGALRRTGIWTHRWKDGTLRKVEITTHDLEFAGRPARLVLANDVTERLAAEEAIRRLNAELEQRVADRTAELEAVNRELEAFSYSVSHDLRAPLRTINGFTRILADEYGPKLDAEGRRICSVISESSRQMGRLIDDLLAFSRAGRAELKMSPIDMATLARSVFFELTTPEARGRIDLRMTSLPAASGDPTLIRQVWANLLSNAIKFSSRNDRAVIELGAETRNGETVYFIRDNGAGFDMRYAAKLFNVFQRLHGAGEFEGTGVGLAIVQRVIHRHGGRIWASAEPGNGAVFSFTLKGAESHG